MPLAPNVNNYSIGKCRVFFKRTGETGYLHIGNCPKVETTPEVTREDHFSSMEGVKLKDFTPVTEQKVMGGFDMEEKSIENIALAFMGDTIVSSVQNAGTFDGEALTLVDDRYIFTGKKNLSYSRVDGDITGTFLPGDIVADGTDFSMDVIEVGSDHLKGFNVSGTIAAGTRAYEQSDTSVSILTTAYSATVEGCLLADNTTQASITDNYEEGTDYDTDAISGMIRKRSDGGISGTVAYAFADYEAKTIKEVTIAEGTSVEGELLFVGTSDIGPRHEVKHWKCELTIGGAFSLVSEAIEALPMTFEALSDPAHPSQPFGYIREIS